MSEPAARVHGFAVEDRVLLRHATGTPIGTVIEVRDRALFPYVCDFAGYRDAYQVQELEPAPDGGA